MASFAQILGTRIVRKAISRIMATTDSMLNFFNMQPGGSAEVPVGHRQASFDIFNDARSVAIGRAPGMPAGVARRQAVGSVNCVFPRAVEKLPLLAEEIHNIRRIGGPTSEFDGRGVAYVAKQQRFLAQRLVNFRKVLLGGMIRGNVYGHNNGDDIYFDYTATAANLTIAYQIPAANLNQCNAIIDVSWANNSGANIPNHLTGLDNAAQAGVGSRIDYAICRGAMWQNVINNDFVVSQAGVANRPFAQFVREIGQGSNGMPLTMKTGVLAAYPMITWIITDEGLDLGPQNGTTYTPFIGANNVWFGPAPNTDIFEGWLGSEPISDGPNMPMVERMGVHAHVTQTFDPTGVALFGYDNFLPVLYVPAATFFATTVF